MAQKDAPAPMQGDARTRVLAGAWGFVRGFDAPVLLATLALLAYGLVVVYSASLTNTDASLPRQAGGVVMGLVVMGAARQFDYRHLAAFSAALFVADCLLMVAPLVPFLSYHANGITGWVQVPGTSLTFQTSELAKPVTVALMAGLCSQHNGRIDRLEDYVRLCATLAVPFALILLQPDLGTGLVVLVAGAAVIVTAGPRRSWVLATIGALAGLVALVLAGNAVVGAATGGSVSIIPQYQLNRLLVFLDPAHDTSSAGYNLQQALIAVGSGGAFGKGLGNATQSAAGFLPESHTDFAFALLAEQFGFVGSVALIALYGVLLVGSLRVALREGALFGKLLVCGLVAMWAFQIFENIGMCLSLMPITGIPLPFISYGSSSTIAQLLCVGLVHSVAAHPSRPA